MMKTGKNNRFLASILAASMMLTMSPFAFAAADTAEQKEMTTQEPVSYTHLDVYKRQAFTGGALVCTTYSLPSSTDGWFFLKWLLATQNGCSVSK